METGQSLPFSDSVPETASMGGGSNIDHHRDPYGAEEISADFEISEALTGEDAGKKSIRSQDDSTSGEEDVDEQRKEELWNEFFQSGRRFVAACSRGLQYFGEQMMRPSLPAKKSKSGDITARLSWWSFKDQSLGILMTIVLLACLTRFFVISNPEEVVFDETHFGKFSNYYINGKFFFDIHPPLGKMLLAAWTRRVAPDYQADYPFKGIGEKYWNHTGPVPYAAMRCLPATFNTLACPIMFFTARQMGMSLPMALLATSMILFDNALIAQSRLILIDSFLFTFIVLSHFSSMGLQHAASQSGAFSKKYWAWLVAAGIFSGCAASVKWTGLATLAGILVQHFFASLYLLHTQSAKQGARRLRTDFFVRILALLSLACLTYLAVQVWHFQRLSLAGPGDGFMTDAFRATLKGSLSADKNYTGPHLSLWGKIVELTKVMFKSNKGMVQPHPWQSRWYSWPIMYRGVHYWHSKSHPNPDGGAELMSHVTLLGNPIVWWLSAGGVVIFVLTALFLIWWEVPFSSRSFTFASYGSMCLVHYFMNLAPYVLVERSTFLYHYFPSLFFAILMCCLTLEHLLALRPKTRLAVALLLLVLVFVGFAYFAPLTYGLLLPTGSYDKRVWIASWRSSFKTSTTTTSTSASS